MCGLKYTTTGDTLCDSNKPVILEKMEFPDPVIEIAIEPKTKADQEKMSVALSRLASEDPSFRIHTDPETGQTFLADFNDRKVRDQYRQAYLNSVVNFKTQFQKNGAGALQISTKDNYVPLLRNFFKSR